MSPRGGGDERRQGRASAEAVEALGPWFHNIDLGGVATAPNHFLGDYPAVKWCRFRARHAR